jgi:hypothetical protein
MIQPQVYVLYVLVYKDNIYPKRVLKLHEDKKFKYWGGRYICGHQLITELIDRHLGDFWRAQGFFTRMSQSDEVIGFIKKNRIKWYQKIFGRWGKELGCSKTEKKDT